MRLRSRLEVGSFVVARNSAWVFVLRTLCGSAMATVAIGLWYVPAPVAVRWISGVMGALAVLTVVSAILRALQGDDDARLRVNMNGIADSNAGGLRAVMYPWNHVRRVVLVEKLRIGTGEDLIFHPCSVLVVLDPTQFSSESWWVRAKNGREMVSTSDLIARGNYARGDQSRTAQAIKDACPRGVVVEVQPEFALESIRRDKSIGALPHHGV